MFPEPNRQNAWSASATEPHTRRAVTPIDGIAMKNRRIELRRILTGETTLAREFPGYVYGKAQWVADGLAGRPLYPVSHRIAGT